MSAAIPDPCLLEAGQLPLRDLAKLAAREGRRPRAIYTGHKWFARRLGTVFRALLVGAGSSPNNDFWKRYYGDASLRNTVVLDPFVGGGTSIMEATRLGATAHAVDIDPVACAISSFQLRAHLLPDLCDVLEALTTSVGEKIRRFHVTAGTDGVQRTVLHHFWVQVVSCHHCGHRFDAHPNYMLGEHDHHRWVFCSRCGEVQRRHVNHKTFKCKTCATRTRIAQGTTLRGKARCPKCGRQRPLISVSRDSGQRPSWRLFALEVLDKPDGGRPIPIADRRFVKASEEDIALYESAELELQKRTGTGFLPENAAINTNRADPRLIDYGYKYWTELFNARQLLHLSLLAEAIEEYDDDIRQGLSIAFSSHLTTNCMMTAYTGKWRRLTPLFSIRAFRHIQRPVEINPWCDGTGRGTFPNAVRKLMRAAQFARKPKEPTVIGGFRQVASHDPAESPNVVCGTARDLEFLADDSVDLVLTDPPYFDNISYSELAEFFVPWLELLEVLEDPDDRETISIESLIGNERNAVAIENYADSLGCAFTEIARVLKPNGLLVFSFRHSSPEAWKALALGLTASELQISSFSPVPGEAGNGLHVHSGTALWDAIFVLRRSARAQPQKNLTISAQQICEIRELVSEWAEQLEDASIPFSDADKLVMLRAGMVGRALAADSQHIANTSISLEKILADPTQHMFDSNAPS